MNPLLRSYLKKTHRTLNYFSKCSDKRNVWAKLKDKTSNTDYIGSSLPLLCFASLTHDCLKDCVQKFSFVQKKCLAVSYDAIVESKGRKAKNSPEDSAVKTAPATKTAAYVRACVPGGEFEFTRANARARDAKRRTHHRLLRRLSARRRNAAVLTLPHFWLVREDGNTLPALHFPRNFAARIRNER